MSPYIVSNANAATRPVVRWLYLQGRYRFWLALAMLSSTGALAGTEQVDASTDSTHPLRLTSSIQLTAPRRVTESSTSALNAMHQDAPEGAIARLAGSTIECVNLQPVHWEALGLAEALSHYLCQSPELRQALSEVDRNRAAVDLVDANGRPQWRANAEYSNYRNFNSSGQAGRTLGASISMSWTLLDFGRRDADTRAANEALAAVEFSADSIAADQLLNFLQLYGAAVIARAKLDSTQQTRATAAQTQAAAAAKYEAKVGSRIEQLQAQTAFSQAKLEHVRAQAAWTTARSQLALALGGEPSQDLKLASWDNWVSTASSILPSGTALAELLAGHPRVRAAEAGVRAAYAQLNQVQANLRPSVGLSASAGNVRNWGAAGRGTIPNSSAALIASMPLFDGRQATAMKKQAQASVEAALAQQEFERRTVMQGIWASSEALEASREALAMSEELLISAKATYDVAQGRYKAGIGTMLELLNAQAALAEALSQKEEILFERISTLTSVEVANGAHPTTKRVKNAAILPR